MRVPSGYGVHLCRTAYEMRPNRREPFPVVTVSVEGVGGSLSLSAPRMRPTLQGHLRTAELPSHSTILCTIHSVETP